MAIGRHFAEKHSRFFLLMLLFVFLFSIITDIPAFASTYKMIDNDDAQGIYSNSYYGFSSTLNYGWWGDARKQASSSSAYYYRYNFDSNVPEVGQFTVSFKAYLASNDFTDTKAEYRVNYGGDSPGFKSAKINQNTAVSGWNTVYSGTVGYSSPVLNYSVSSVEVRPSGLSSSYGTGADGIEITIY